MAQPLRVATSSVRPQRARIKHAHAVTRIEKDDISLRFEHSRRASCKDQASFPHRHWSANNANGWQWERVPLGLGVHVAAGLSIRWKSSCRTWPKCDLTTAIHA